MTRYAKSIFLIEHQHDLLAWRREHISNHHSIVLWLHRSTTRIEGRHSGLRHSVCTSRSFNLHGSVSWWPCTLIWGRAKPRTKPSSGYSVTARSHSTMMANRHFPAASLILWRLKSIWPVRSAWWVCCYSRCKDIVLFCSIHKYILEPMQSVIYYQNFLWWFYRTPSSTPLLSPVAICSATCVVVLLHR